MSAKLTCKDMLGEMSDYVDGAACEELEKHIAECPDCRIVVNTLRKTVELYHQVPTSPPSEKVRDRLFFRLDLARYSFPAELNAEYGELCPICAEAELEINEMLNLVCPACGWTQAGCST